MNKKVVIHFGPGKTGSSALQAWFNSQSEMLNREGVFYPPHAVDANGVSSGNIESITNRKHDGTREVDEKKLSWLLFEFEQSNAHTLLLSSEFFFPILRDLFAVLPNAIYMGYIRDPLELHESDYNQRVKLHSYYLPFHAPIGSFPVVDALARVMDDCKGINLQLRPYGKALFCGGSIVSDLLSAVAPLLILPDFDVTNSVKVVNSSYDFATREFKRLLNYFPIQHLELDIHRLLQKRPAEEEYISVIPENAQISANQTHVKRLEVFIKNRRMETLAPLLEALKNRPLKAYKSQDADIPTLLKVSGWLKENDYALFKQITKVVNEYRHFYVDNPAFWACFEKPVRKERSRWWKKASIESGDKKSTSSICNQSIAAFKQRTRMPGDVHPPHILASMAEFAMANGEYRLADKWFSEALARNPKQLLALRLVNEARNHIKVPR